MNGHRKKLTLEHTLSLDEYETFGRELTWEAAALRDNRSLTLRQPKGDDVAHSEDFRSMRWGEELFSFTANQAPAVKMLFENWQRGTPDVGNETLCEAIDQPAPPKRLDILFRGHPAWGTLIVSGGTKGTHRMSDPQKKS